MYVEIIECSLSTKLCNYHGKYTGRWRLFGGDAQPIHRRETVGRRRREELT